MHNKALQTWLLVISWRWRCCKFTMAMHSFRICDINAQRRRVFITGTYVSSRHFEKSFRSIMRT